MNNGFFNSLFNAEQNSKLAGDMENRSLSTYQGIVSDNKDPSDLRRIKVEDPLMPQLETTWLRRLVPYHSFDAPMPKVGSTVTVFSIDGVATNGWWLECLNDTNPALNKENPLLDLHSIVEGKQNERTDDSRVLSVGTSLTLQNDAGAAITLAENGDVVISDAAGNTMTLAGGIAFETASLTVASKEITTVGATDTRGDDLVSKGW